MYGFTFTHFIPKSLVDMGIFQLELGYGILLSQTWLPSNGNRAISDTELFLVGGEFTLASQHHLGFTINLETSDLPSFVGANNNINTVGFDLFYRLLF